MAIYGPRSPTAVSTVSTPFTNPNNLLLLDGVYASSAPATGGFSNSAYLSGYGFAIPPSATITTITVRIYHQGAPAGRFFLVRMFYGGALQAFNNDFIPISVGPGVATITGNLAYFLSGTLTPALANASDFGPAIFDRNNADATAATLLVDYVSVEINASDESFRLNQRPWRVV